MPFRAFVLITVKPGTSQEIVRSRKIHGVKMASSVFGRYDVVLIIEADEMSQISRTIYDVIEKHHNVIRTETLISVFPPGASWP